MRDEIIHPFPNGWTVEVWEWINDFIPHFIGHVITYPCWDEIESISVKGAPDVLCGADINLSPAYATWPYLTAAVLYHVTG